ncbi:MAG: choloylglycine hydrolase [Erysipelotrichaceae bacterium]|nr:choloylglycine hydrolase [Erysipelotrichaceae bacterium]
MCTAATYKTKDFYFGRTLDFEFSYGEKVCITPRNYPIEFLNGKKISNHYAIIGMAHIIENYPLYYEAANEKGLAIAGLNFVGNAKYFPFNKNKENVAQYEFILYILSHCKSVLEAKKLLKNINITNDAFNEHLPVAYLHWIIADKAQAITVESTKDGLKVYDNKIGVLTNNPPFEMQMFALNNYINLSTTKPINKFLKGYKVKQYSRGMGGIGLPGDLSSQSRFIRVAFTKMNSISSDNENESVSQFFHILDSVCQQRGCCEVKKNEYEITIYTSCINASKGIYYYTTYDNHQINCIDMYHEDLNAKDLITYPVIDIENFNRQN